MNACDSLMRPLVCWFVRIRCGFEIKIGDLEFGISFLPGTTLIVISCANTPIE